jgi:hypothetical protein
MLQAFIVHILSPLVEITLSYIHIRAARRYVSDTGFPVIGNISFRCTRRAGASPPAVNTVTSGQNL